MPDNDQLIGELRQLRKGRGLTAAKLAACPAIMTALGKDSPTTAHTALLGIVDELGDDLPVRALRNALAIGLTSPGSLTQRRSDFGVNNDRHPDTLEAYENRMLDELAAKVAAANPVAVKAGDVLYVLGLASGRHITSLFELPIAKDQNLDIATAVRDGKPISIPAGLRMDPSLRDAEFVGPGLACLFYQAPVTNLPEYLFLGAAFTEPPYPKKAWGFHGATLLELNLMGNIQLAKVVPPYALAPFKNPQRGHYYGIYWKLK